MDSLPDISGLSPKLQLHLLTAYVLMRSAGELWSVVRKGGGLRNIIVTFWMGENTPKAMTDDLAQRRSEPPFPVAQVSTTNNPPTP